MSAREEILRRIRLAHDRSGAAPSPQPPRGYRRAGTQPDATTDLVELLVDRLVDYRAGVHRCDPDTAADVVAAVLARHGARRVVVPAGFPPDLIPTGVEAVADEPALTPAELDRLDGALTTSAVAVAETGTLVLDAGPGQGRRALTLVPDLHVVVVCSADVVRGLAEAIARLQPTAPLTWISGPSATSDIELNRVEGVHGPRRLEVIVVAG